MVKAICQCVKFCGSPYAACSLRNRTELDCRSFPELQGQLSNASW
jgi:hypothetical protein